MEWIKFEDKYLDRFLSFIRNELTDLLNKLSNFEKSIFNHYWLKILNDHDSYLLIDGDKNLGFISKPDWRVKHWVRWPENNLIISKDMKEELKIPEDFKENIIYRTNNSKNIIYKGSKLIQAAYGRRIDDFKMNDMKFINKDIACHELKGKVSNEIIALLDKDKRAADVESKFYEQYYIPKLVENLENNYKYSTGFAFYASLKESKDPIAISYYDGFELPLTGTPCLLINDIVVKKEFRRKRIASTLQAYAYEKLKKENVRWIVGNIEKGNISSEKQSKALGRYEWASMIELREELK